MVGVDTHAVTLEVKGKLAVFDVLQFIFMQVRPPPQSGIDYMREAFTSRHLGTTTQRRESNKFNCKDNVIRTGVKRSVKSIIEEYTLFLDEQHVKQQIQTGQNALNVFSTINGL